MAISTRTNYFEGGSTEPYGRGREHRRRILFSRARSPAVTSEAYSFWVDQAAILKRIQELRDEIDFLVRQNKEYDAYRSHTINDAQLHARRMERLEQIKRELADIKAGKFPPPNISED